jgi:hypothetical protein
MGKISSGFEELHGTRLESTLITVREKIRNGKRRVEDRRWFSNKYP